MKKVKFKLQNLLFIEKYGLKKHWWMLYRTNSEKRMKRDPLKSCSVLKKGDVLDGFTYFNSISVRKWKKYTCAQDITLNIKAAGDFAVTLFGCYSDTGEIKEESLSRPMFFSSPVPVEVSLAFPKRMSSTVCGFYIEAFTDTEIYGGYYSAFVDEKAIREVNISIATTTFKKEEYIENNVRLLERELFYSGEEAGRHFFMRITDNGRTLDPEEFNSECVQVYPNDNVGGSGGFTRGILETLKDKRATHVLLMDDDVKILPESLIRTWSVLSLVKEEYKEHFISGAMLYMERMNTQREDVGYLHPDGSYGPRKPSFELHLKASVLKNEEEYSEMPYSYAGWWYCCIPVSTIDTNNLPIPLFIRGDDVEYSVSKKAKFITLSGICIWHKGFTNKYTAALELYLVHRNSFITQAMSGIYTDVDFLDRIEKLFQKEIRRLSYSSCELLLDSIEDYLDGPEFMMTPQGERIMKEHSAKNEKMTDIRDVNDLNCLMLDFNELKKEIIPEIYEKAPLKGFKKFLYDFTYNGQRGPGFFVKDELGIIAYDWFDAPKKQYMKKEILAVNPVENTAYLRKRSRKRFKELMKRHRAVMRRYRRTSKKVAAEYAQAGKTLKSEKFWKNYLNME